MKIGIGLPGTVPGATGSDILEWARCADAGPFSCLGIIDRLVYSTAGLRVEFWEQPKPAPRRLRLAERIAIVGRLPLPPAADAAPTITASTSLPGARSFARLLPLPLEQSPREAG
jgi:hypothetical protein